MANTILLYGNEDVSFDRGALLLEDVLKQAFPSSAVRHAKQPDEVLSYLDGNLLIVDVAKGISEPVLFTDPDLLIARKTVTAHDLDLASFLKMLKAVGTITEIPIVAIPCDVNPTSCKDKVCELIASVQGKNKP